MTQTEHQGSSDVSPQSEVELPPTQYPELDIQAAKDITSNSNGHSHVSDIDLLEFKPDDNGNAEAMYLIYKDKLLYSPAYGWMRWTGTYWQRVSSAISIRFAINTLKRRGKAAIDSRNTDIAKICIPYESRISACAKLYKAYATIEKVDGFDKDPDLLNCLNGVVNLRTGSVTPHLPCQRFTYCVPVAYKPDADMSLWTEFIHDALVNDDIVHYIQKCVGYTFTGHTREEKLFYAYGPPRAGKGTFTETLLALLPRPIGTEVDFNSFTAKRDADNQNFDLAPLKPARFIVASESNRYQSLNPAKIKQVTGGNLIRAAFKHQDFFEYKPQFKVWLVSNHPVNADVDDDALWGRVQVVTFPKSYLGREDTTLKSRLIDTQNLEGVLRWVVEGAMDYYKIEKLEPPEEIVKATQKQRESQDYISQWLDECCELRSDMTDDSMWTASYRVMASYKSWCESNNISTRYINIKDLISTLTKRFGCELNRQKDRGSRVRGLTGIEIISSIHDGYGRDNNVDGGRTGQEKMTYSPHDRHIEECRNQMSNLSTRPHDVETDVLNNDENSQKETGSILSDSFTCVRCQNTTYTIDGGLKLCAKCGYSVVA